MNYGLTKYMKSLPRLLTEPLQFECSDSPFMSRTLVQLFFQNSVLAPKIERTLSLLRGSLIFYYFIAIFSTTTVGTAQKGIFRCLGVKKGGPNNPPGCVKFFKEDYRFRFLAVLSDKNRNLRTLQITKGFPFQSIVEKLQEHALLHFHWDSGAIYYDFLFIYLMLVRLCDRFNSI